MQKEKIKQEADYEKQLEITKKNEVNLTSATRKMEKLVSSESSVSQIVNITDNLRGLFEKSF